MPEPKGCSIEGCSKPALFKVAKDGYCKQHKRNAVERRKRYVRFLDGFKAERERDQKVKEARLKEEDKRFRTWKGY